MSRFFHPAGFADSLPGSLISLDKEEAHHASRVLRMQVGELVELFDGSGNSLPAKLLRVEKRGVDVEVCGPMTATSSPRSSIILATAMPKGDRLRWLVEKGTELGVYQIIPLRTERSVVQGGSGKVEKMEQVVIAACKQCRRNDLMSILDPMSWDSFWRLPLVSTEPGTVILLAHPDGGALSSVFEIMHRESVPQRIVWLIGPEGGFSPREADEAIARGAIPISLGNLILRIETAAILAAAVTGASPHR
ncbi:MAG: RsmE family RNA methyltransferase [Planctomycetaceae bacterium]